MAPIPIAIVVTDDWESRHVMQEALQIDYEVMLFESCADMLEMLSRINQRVRLIVIDFNERISNAQDDVSFWIQSVLKITPIPDLCILCDPADSHVIQATYISGATVCLTRPVSTEQLRVMGQSCLRDTERNHKLIHTILRMLPDHPDVLKLGFASPPNDPHSVDMAYWLRPFFDAPKGSIVFLESPSPSKETLALQQFLQTHDYSTMMGHTLPMVESACRTSGIDMLMMNTQHPELEQVLTTMIQHYPHLSILFWVTNPDPTPFIHLSNRYGIPCFFVSMAHEQLMSRLGQLLQYRSLLFLLSDRLYRRQLMEIALPFATRIHFLQRFVDAAMLKNQLIYFSDLLYYIPELYGVNNPPNHPIDPSDLSDGAMVYVYELQATLS